MSAFLPAKKKRVSHRRGVTKKSLREKATARYYKIMGLKQQVKELTAENRRLKAKISTIRMKARDVIEKIFSDSD